MPALPKIPRGFITNFHGVIPDFVEHTQFIFLLASSALIVLITGVFLIGIESSRTSQFPNKDFNFSSAAIEAKYNGYLTTAKSTADPVQAVKYYEKAIWAISADYDLMPSVQKRDFIKDLAVFVKSNYPLQTQDVFFDIPCKEGACDEKFDYTKGLSSIRDSVKNNEKLNPEVRQSILSNVQNAALLAGRGDTEQEFNTLTSVFESLRDEWRRTNDDKTKLAAEKTLALMEKIAPDSYRVGVEHDLYKL